MTRAAIREDRRVYGRIIRDQDECVAHLRSWVDSARATWLKSLTHANYARYLQARMRLADEFRNLREMEQWLRDFEREVAAVNPVKCFLLEPTGRSRLWLRRYLTGNCPSGACHNVMLLHGDIDEPSRGSDLDRVILDSDPRWPKSCPCGFVFPEDTDRQRFTRSLWKRADTGEIMTIEDAPPGAIWNNSWFCGIEEFCGPDGLALCCKLPNSLNWHIDGRARNCGSPDDKGHKCWVRHGEPPLLTVDKNGNTCAAGAGSIQKGDWHGFLREGFLVTA